MVDSGTSVAGPRIIPRSRKRRMVTLDLRGCTEMSENPKEDFHMGLVSSIAISNINEDASEPSLAPLDSPMSTGKLSMGLPMLSLNTDSSPFISSVPDSLYNKKYFEQPSARLDYQAFGLSLAELSRASGYISDTSEAESKIHLETTIDTVSENDDTCTYD